jgi:hypothetical protein
MLVALIVSLISRSKPAHEQGGSAGLSLLAAGVTVATMVYYYADFNGAGQQDPLGFGQVVKQAFTIEYGAVVSGLGAVGAGVGGVVQLGAANQKRT